MSIKTLTTLAALTSALLISVPAQATVQNDIAICHAAISAQTSMDTKDFTLKFTRKDGVTTSRARTLYFKVIGNNEIETFSMSCQLNKSTVVALNTDNAVRYAAR